MCCVWEVMWYRCEGTNQSASVARVWPGQPQGVVFKVRLAQVALIDDHCTGSSVGLTDKQVPIYCRLQCSFILSLEEKLALRHVWEYTCRRCQRESCFTLPLNKKELIPFITILFQKLIVTQLVNKPPIINFPVHASPPERNDPVSYSELL